MKHYLAGLSGILKGDVRPVSTLLKLSSVGTVLW